MTNVAESPFWEPGIYQLETTDPVMGGANGIDNLQAKQLANRTNYLKQQIDEGLNAIDVLLLAKTDAQTLTAGVFNAINFNSVQYDPANLVSDPAVVGSTWVIPAGYSHVRISGYVAIDPPDGDNVIYSVGMLVNGSKDHQFATANGGRDSLTGAEALPAAFSSPFIAVTEGDTVGVYAYLSSTGVTIANKCWMQAELVKS